MEGKIKVNVLKNTEIDYYFWGDDEFKDFILQRDWWEFIEEKYVDENLVKKHELSKGQRLQPKPLSYKEISDIFNRYSDDRDSEVFYDIRTLIKEIHRLHEENDSNEGGFNFYKSWFESTDSKLQKIKNIINNTE